MIADPSIAETQHESLGGVIGLGLGLLIIVLAGLMPLYSPADDADAGEVLRESFGVQDPLPHGLEPARAVSFANGVLVVLLYDPQRALPEHNAPRWEKPKGGKGGGFRMGGEAGKKPEIYDWSTVPIVQDGGPPVEAALALFPPKVGAEVVDSQFHSLRYEDVTQLSTSGKTVPVDSGHLDWGPYEAPYVQLRHFGRDEEGPGSWDTLRVNLTTESQARILYLRWPRGQAGHPDRAAEILQVLPVSPRE